MAKTIKELAKELNCSYEAVRKQTKRYAKELQEHIYTQHKTQYLDDYACEFIRDKRMDTPAVISAIESAEAVELLKTKYMELLEAHNALRDERDKLAEANRQLEAENAKIMLLEAQKSDLSGLCDELRAEADEFKKTAQNANMELSAIKDKWYYKWFGKK